MLGCMRTTVDLPDELLRSARARAAQDGTTLTALLADGLRMRLDPPLVTPPPFPVLPGRGGLLPGIDPNSNSSMLDAADDLL